MSQRVRDCLWAAWDRISAWARRKIPRLSRPWRLARNIVVLVPAVYLMWMCAGGEPLTEEWAFRWAEQQALVGPSDILGTFEVTPDPDYPASERYMVGETEDGLLVGRVSGNWLEGCSARLTYWEKTGDITLVPLDQMAGGSPDDGETAYFLCRTSLPGAAYGELELECRDYDLTGQWDVSAELQNGCFLFPCEDFYRRYTAALSGSMAGGPAGETEAAYTLRVYDSRGELLGERSWSWAEEWEDYWQWRSQLWQEYEAKYGGGQDAPETE